MSIGDAIKHELDTEDAIDDNPLNVGEKVQKDAEQRSAISAQVVYEAIRQEGQDELKRPSSALFWSGLAAGLSMGFSLVAEALINHSLPNASWTPLISKLGYSVGYVCA